MNKVLLTDFNSAVEEIKDFLLTMAVVCEKKG